MDATAIVSSRLRVVGGFLRLKGSRDAEPLRIGAEPCLVGRDASCELVIADRRVSAVHAEFVATDRGVRMRDVGSRNGVWVAGVQVTEGFLTEPCSVWLSDVELTFEPAQPERIKVEKNDGVGKLVGSSPAMRAVFERLRRVGPTELTVLLQGETGTGKELAAQALHALSRRRDAPFVVVDCGAIPPSLAEATLFGHERGAFTGAVDKRPSPFVEAEGGTVFLDELGELPLDVQPKLLRVLAERRIKPVGAQKYLPVDVRVVAATRRDLARAVNEGGFRSDLFFRIAQFRIDMPALRERPGDIPALIRKTLRDAGDENASRRISEEEVQRLMRYDWPGNVRELTNAVIAAHAMAGPRADIDVASYAGGASGSPPSAPRGNAATASYHDAKRSALERFEREFFAPLVAQTEGNVAEIARIAGLERAHVRRYLKRHGLRKPK